MRSCTCYLICMRLRKCSRAFRRPWSPRRSSRPPHPHPDAPAMVTTSVSCRRCRRHGHHIRLLPSLLTPWSLRALHGRSSRSSRSGSGFVAAGPVPANRTAKLVGPVRLGPPAAGPTGGSVKARTGPDRVHPDPRYTVKYKK